MKVAVVECYEICGRHKIRVDTCVFACEKALEAFVEDNPYDDVEYCFVDMIGMAEKAE